MNTHKCVRFLSLKKHASWHIGTDDGTFACARHVDGNEVSFADLFVRAYRGGSELWKVEPCMQAHQTGEQVLKAHQTGGQVLIAHQTDGVPDCRDRWVFSPVPQAIVSSSAYSAELSEKSQASVSHTTGSGPVRVYPCLVLFFSAGAAPILYSAYEDEAQDTARPPGQSFAPKPFVVVHDDFVSEGIVASVVVFVPLVVMTYWARCLVDWRWLQRISRETLMSISLLQNRFCSSQLCLAPTRLTPGSGHAVRLSWRRTG